MSVKNNSGADNAPKANFPPESEEGTVRIEGNRIISEGADWFGNCEIEIDKILFVYLVVSKKKETYLHLFDNHQHHIPTHYKGFREVYLWLSEKFGFNDRLFFEHVLGVEPLKKELWRKMIAQNYQILPEGRYDDYGEGFEIQSPDKEFISWDTTYEKLQKSRNIYFDISPYDQKILRFQFPVRIGNIMLQHLTLYFDNPRTDVPVLHFYANCFDQANADGSYFELRNRLKEDINQKDHLLNYERDDQKSFSFKINGMLISLGYTYDNDWQFDRGNTSFSIENKRAYPELLMDPDYEDKMEVSSYVLLNNQVQMMGDYKRDARIKRRPQKLPACHPDFSMIWIDRKNGKIGFADKSYAVWHPMSSIKSFSILNILPAKGPGGAYLTVYFAEGRKSYTILTGKCHVFDPYREKIAKLGGKEVVMEPEHYDC